MRNHWMTTVFMRNRWLYILGADEFRVRRRRNREKRSQQQLRSDKIQAERESKKADFGGKSSICACIPTTLSYVTP